MQGWRKLGCIEIILASDADEGEEGIASGVGQSRSHALRGSRFGDRTDRPFGRDPLARRVSQYCRKPDEPSRLIDRGCLHRRDLMQSEALAHEVEPGGQGGVAEAAITPRSHAWYGPGERLLRVGELELGFGEGCGDRADRFARTVHGRSPRS